MRWQVLVVLLCWVPSALLGRGRDGTPATDLTTEVGRVPGPSQDEETPNRAQPLSSTGDVDPLGRAAEPNQVEGQPPSLDLLVFDGQVWPTLML